MQQRNRQKIRKREKWEKVRELGDIEQERESEIEKGRDE